MGYIFCSVYMDVFLFIIFENKFKFLRGISGGMLKIIHKFHKAKMYELQGWSHIDQIKHLVTENYETCLHANLNSRLWGEGHGTEVLEFQILFSCYT